MRIDALVDKLVDKVEGWGAALVVMLPNLLVALMVVAAAIVASRTLGKVFRRTMRRFSTNQPIIEVLVKIARAVVVVVGIFVALGILQLDKTVTSLLAGVGVLGLALGFAFQDIASNFMSGFLMALRRPFRVGDLVRTGDYYGRVERIDLRVTSLVLLTGQHVIVPNKQVFQNPMVNYSRLSRRRVDLEVGISYGDDLDEVKRVTLAAVAPLEVRDAALYFTGFGNSSIDFVLHFWIDATDEPSFLAARSRAIVAIKKAYDAHGITIPFPIRTLDFGIVGGTRLDQVLPHQASGSGNAALPG